MEEGGKKRSNSDTPMRGGNDKDVIHVYFLNSRVSSCLTLQHLVVDSLFTGDDEVKSVLAALKALRLGFNSLIAVQHVQDAILCVSEGAGSRNTSAETFQVKPDTKRISTATTK